MTENENKLALALARFRERTGVEAGPFEAVLFDMDGVLYDSMPLHARAWKAMCDEYGIEAQADEFFAHEGRTGAATIDILIRRQWNRPATDDEARDLYAVKSRNFKASGEPPLMPGADKATSTAARHAVCVLVTGSGQKSILERLERDYPGVFPEQRRITSADTVHGKPDPEPYLKGMQRAGAAAHRCIAIDNAPLGVESASRAGAFTIGVRTGPLDPGMLEAAGADIEINSMDLCARLLGELLK